MRALVVRWLGGAHPSCTRGAELRIRIVRVGSHQHPRSAARCRAMVLRYSMATSVLWTAAGSPHRWGPRCAERRPRHRERKCGNRPVNLPREGDKVSSHSGCHEGHQHQDEQEEDGDGEHLWSDGSDPERTRASTAWCRSAAAAAAARVVPKQHRQAGCGSRCEGGRCGSGGGVGRAAFVIRIGQLVG